MYLDIIHMYNLQVIFKDTFGFVTWPPFILSTVANDCNDGARKVAN